MNKEKKMRNVIVSYPDYSGDIYDSNGKNLTAELNVIEANLTTGELVYHLLDERGYPYTVIEKDGDQLSKDDSKKFFDDCAITTDLPPGTKEVLATERIQVKETPLRFTGFYNQTNKYVDLSG